MQTTTKFSEKQVKPNQSQNSVSEQPVNVDRTVLAKELQPLEPQTSNDLIAHQEIDEVDPILADFLATGNFVSSNSANAARQLNAALAVINHEKGKRLKVQNEVLQRLGVQVGDFINATVKNKQVILLKSSTDEGVHLKKGGFLYNSELVVAITNEFAFDFSNQSTHHLLNVTYKKWSNQVIAIITP